MISKNEYPGLKGRISSENIEVDHTRRDYRPFIAGFIFQLLRQFMSSTISYRVRR